MNDWLSEEEEISFSVAGRWQFETVDTLEQTGTTV